MIKSRLSLVIWLGSYGITIIIFLLAQNMRFESWEFIINNSFSLISISFSWRILAFIWQTKEENTKKLKTILLIINFYLLSLIFLKPNFNLNHYEFWLLYIAFIRLFFLLIPVYKPINVKIEGWFWWIIILFLISINFLMIYRQPAPIQEFIFQESFQIISNSQSPQYNSTLIIHQWWKTKYYTLPLKFPLSLQPNSEYQIIYQSPFDSEEDKNIFLIISDPSGNNILIFPQSSLFLTTKENVMNYQYKSWKFKFLTHSSQISQSDFFLIQNIQENYINKKQKFILKSLPIQYQNNSQLQYLSYQYTKIIAKILPFYQTNFYYATTYEPFFIKKGWVSLPEKSIEENKIIEKNSKIWLWKTLSFKKFLSWFSTFF